MSVLPAWMHVTICLSGACEGQKVKSLELELWMVVSHRWPAFARVVTLGFETGALILIG